MKANFNFNDIIWSIETKVVDLPACRVCSGPREGVTFYCIIPLYIFEKIERFDGFINYGATEHPVEEFLSKEEKKWHWYSISPVLTDNEFDRVPHLNYNKFSTKEEAIKVFVEKHRDKIPFYQHCLREYRKKDSCESTSVNWIVPDVPLLDKIFKRRKHE